MLNTDDREPGSRPGTLHPKLQWDPQPIPRDFVATPEIRTPHLPWKLYYAKLVTFNCVFHLCDAWLLMEVSHPSMSFFLFYPLFFLSYGLPPPPLFLTFPLSPLESSFLILFSTFLSTHSSSLQNALPSSALKETWSPLRMLLSFLSLLLSRRHILPHENIILGDCGGMILSPHSLSYFYKSSNISLSFMFLWSDLRLALLPPVPCCLPFSLCSFCQLSHPAIYPVPATILGFTCNNMLIPHNFLD